MRRNFLKFSLPWLVAIGCIFISTTRSLAGISENLVPQQEEALDVATAFLVALDLEDFAEVQSKIAPEVFNAEPPAATFKTIRLLHVQLGGPSISERQLISAKPTSALPGYSRRSTYLTVRFRTAYRVGAIFEDVSLEFTRDEWRVVGFWFSPAAY